MRKTITIITALLISAYAYAEDNKSAADDVLFLVLGKMSIYIQDLEGNHILRDHHFVAEIMPKENGEILGGTLTRQNDPDFKIPFNAEGRQFLAHGERVMSAEELHQAHPDGTYIFNYRTKNGEITGQALTLKKRATTEIMPSPATLSLSQNGSIIAADIIDPDQDLIISWTPMKGNLKAESSELADLIFVLSFDCFGNNISHSGRPYNGKPFLTYQDTIFTIPATSLLPGISYQLIVEQATADVERHHDIPGIATYATLTFLDAKTTGSNNGETCPVK